MDRIGEIKKSTMAVIILLSLVLGSLILVAPEPVVNAGVAEEKDEYGYYWTDSKEPGPQVEYTWINAVTSGTELEIYGSTGTDNVPLDFDFEIYGQAYDEIFVGSRGFVYFNDTYNPGSDYYNGIPNSGVSGPMIMVAFGYPYNDYTSYGGIHYLESPAGADPKWICIEWNANYYQMTYQLVLYESGLIKMQYNNMGTSTSYQTGQSISAGIQDENNFTAYSAYNQANLEASLAVEFSTEEMHLQNLMIENGEGEGNHTAYAENAFYEFSFDVVSTLGYQDVSMVKVFFGDPSLNIYIKLVVGGGSHNWENGGGSKYYTLDINYSRDMTIPNAEGLSARFFIMFHLSIPIDGNTSISVWGRGDMALPNMTVFDDAFYLDSVLRIQGDMTAYNGLGEQLETEGYVKEFDNITFAGVTITYNTTALVYPPNSSFSFQITDDELVTHYDMNASGREMHIWFIMPNVAIRKVFTASVRDAKGEIFEKGKLIGKITTLALKVDDSSPIAPTSLVLRADSFKDSQKDVDNDDIIYVSWSSVSDSGSGVEKYRIWTTYDPGNEDIPYVDSTTTQFIWNKTTEGLFKIFVWAEDGVNHYGDFIDATIKIDKKDPFFVEFYPAQDEIPWVRTLTPEVRIKVKDNLTIPDAISGVRPSTIEYSISTDGVDNFEEWISADLYDDEDINPEDTLDVELNPRFVEGRENYIRYRAKDYAGNGFSYSDTYNLQIDVTPVAFEEFFPTPNVWHDINVINNREISVYLVDETSGVGTTQMYYRISNSYDPDKATNQQYNWITGVPQQNGWEKLTAKQWDRIDGSKRIWVHFMNEHEFQAGDQNFVQFMVRDVAKNGNFRSYFDEMMTLSPMYQVKVNTQPVAIITSPTLDNREFDLTDLIVFDASGSYDIDVDSGNLKYEWFVKELNRSIGFDEVLEDIRFEITGWYNVTLYVGDSVHRYDPVTGEDTRSSASIRVLIKRREIDPNIDDGDGMPALWEVENLLDPYDGSDGDEDSDLDGFTNYQEYKAGTDPWDTSSKPVLLDIEPGRSFVKDAPFGLWIFIVILVAAILIAGIVVLTGYLRIQRKEQREKTEEAEEEAMLATPQLDIPSMPVSMPADNVPTTEEFASALPPAQVDEMPQPGEPVPAPMEPAPVESGAVEPQYAPEEPQQVEQPPMQPAPVESPVYEEQTQEQQNPMYDQQ